MISGYGTYLFSYYDAAENLLSTKQGDWRWKTDSSTAFTVFEVKSPSETFEESNTIINIVQISDTTLQLSENTSDSDLGEQTFTYSLQLASLTYQDTECGDFSSISTTD